MLRIANRYGCVMNERLCCWRKHAVEICQQHLALDGSVLEDAKYDPKMLALDAAEDFMVSTTTGPAMAVMSSGFATDPRRQPTLPQAGSKSSLVLSGRLSGADMQSSEVLCMVCIFEQLIRGTPQ
jgi:hypothetical protein